MEISYLPNMLYPLTGEVRKACSFVIRMDLPLQTAKDILEFLLDRRILLETMQMYGVGGGEAMLILHCHIEKDRMRHLQNGLEKMNGILSVDLLESRVSNRSVPVPLLAELLR